MGLQLKYFSYLFSCLLFIWLVSFPQFQFYFYSLKKSFFYLLGNRKQETYPDSKLVISLFDTMCPCLPSSWRRGLRCGMPDPKDSLSLNHEPVSEKPLKFHDGVLNLSYVVDGDFVTEDKATCHKTTEKAGRKEKDAYLDAGH